MVQRGARITRRDSGHRNRNLLNQLLEYGKIETTFARAQKISPLVEGLIEKAKYGGLPARRYLLRYLGDAEARKLLEEIAPRFRNIKGGYMRIRRNIQRRGDAALLATIEILEGEKVEEGRKGLKRVEEGKGKSERKSVKSATKSARSAGDSRRVRSASKAKSGHHH